MKMKLVCSMILTLAVVSLLPAMGVATDGATLLVVPARYSVIQVAFDMAQRFPVSVLSYQGDASTEAPVLHAWNGAEWVPVQVADYEQGNFLHVTPNRVVVVGDEKLAPPVLTSAASAWCPQVVNVASVETAPLVNEMAKLFSFSRYDWDWFSKRYNLTLQDANTERRSKSWYDRASYEDKWSKKKLRETKQPAPASFELAPAEQMPVPVIESEPAPEAAAPVAAEEPAVEAAAPVEDLVPADAATVEQPAAEEAYPVK
ncbi:MAG TPA: hypothetical protein PLE77_13675 [Kiritimatiellia bacterium]|nr:hypothetical protein [Kiritimatiellia bacterium]